MFKFDQVAEIFNQVHQSLNLDKDENGVYLDGNPRIRWQYWVEAYQAFVEMSVNMSKEEMLAIDRTHVREKLESGYADHEISKYENGMFHNPEIQFKLQCWNAAFQEFHSIVEGLKYKNKQMKVNTEGLTGLALDWFVLACEGATNLRLSDNYVVYEMEFDGDTVTDYLANCSPSSDWSVGGPIITRIGIDIRQMKADKSILLDKRHFDASLGDVLETVSPSGLQMVRRPKPPHPLDGKFLARISKGTGEMVRWDTTDFLSDEPLVAAMRCYVANTLGYELELPDVLMEVAAENNATVSNGSKPKL